jgi:hypothetical protein
MPIASHTCQKLAPSEVIALEAEAQARLAADKPYREVAQRVYECFRRRKSEDTVAILKAFAPPDRNSVDK